MLSMLFSVPFQILFVRTSIFSHSERDMHFAAWTGAFEAVIISARVLMKKGEHYE